MGVKDLSAVKVYRYEDSVLGPRVLPQFGNPLVGKVPVNDGKFEVDVEQKVVRLISANGSKVDVGQQFIYLVE